jgi:hypothetical protein
MRQIPRHLPFPLIAERGRYFYAPVHSRRRWPLVAAWAAVAALVVLLAALGAAAWECAI